MNLDSLTAALSHIGNLVASLTKKNLNSSVQEIQEVSALLFLVCLPCKCLWGNCAVKVLFGSVVLAAEAAAAASASLLAQLDAAAAPHSPRHLSLPHLLLLPGL